MNLNTMESTRKRTLACVGVFLMGLGLYLGSQGTGPMVIGLIVTGIYAADRILEARD